MTKLNQLAIVVVVVGIAMFIDLWFEHKDLKEQLAAAHPVRTWNTNAFRADGGVVTALPLIPPAPPLTHSRPWVKLPSGDSYFDFSGDEWGAMTNAFAEKLESDSALRFDEGRVHRVSESRLKAMSNADTVRTNIVWFFAPVMTNPPTATP